MKRRLKKVRITKNNKVYEGLLISEEDNTYIIKLDNGYNIGLKGKIEVIGEVKIEELEKSEETGGEVVILGCGGTISSKVDYNTGAVYPSISPSSLISQFPEIKDISSIETKEVFSVFSEDMNAKHWHIMAEEILKEINKGKSVVILHGTDTMHYSSAAISFAIQNPKKPIIFTGAQRSSDRPSSDNKLNLLNSIYASKKEFNDIGIVMHAQTDDSFAYLIKGTNARKMHTSRRDAFKSINIPPLAKIDYKRNMFEELWHINKNSSMKVDTRFNENTALIYFYPGMKASDLEKFLDKEGVVVAGTGLGHVSLNYTKNALANSLEPALKKFYDSDIPVVISPQTIYGRINLNVYSTGRKLKELGVIGHNLNLTPETAYVKLSWVLGHVKGIENVREEMNKDFIGELERSIASKEY